jgi:putative transcriptional regulator
MTLLGEYLARKSVNRALISRKTGISKTRLNELCNNPSTQLKVRELYLIAVAIEVVPDELMLWVCKGLNPTSGP